ncbi:MAG TPA: PilZ domain-containing protein [Polyangiales bacterium]|nr:PilZ domain-containing protein [Polyangiales bacterium]
MVADDRRRFPRLNVPVFYRPARLLGPRQVAQDVSRGGIRVYTDDALAIGTRLEIELFLPEGDSLTVDVRVAWVRELTGQDARFEAGLEFLAMDEARTEAVERCISEHRA